jgi:hypothetical protein
MEATYFVVLIAAFLGLAAFAGYLVVKLVTGSQ